MGSALESRVGDQGQTQNLSEAEPKGQSPAPGPPAAGAPLESPRFLVFLFKTKHLRRRRIKQ